MVCHMDFCHKHGDKVIRDLITRCSCVQRVRFSAKFSECVLPRSPCTASWSPSSSVSTWCRTKDAPAERRRSSSTSRTSGWTQDIRMRQSPTYPGTILTWCGFVWSVSFPWILNIDNKTKWTSEKLLVSVIAHNIIVPCVYTKILLFMRKQNKKIAGELPAIYFDLIPLPCLNETFYSYDEQASRGGHQKEEEHYLYQYVTVCFLLNIFLM